MAGRRSQKSCTVVIASVVFLSVVLLRCRCGAAEVKSGQNRMTGVNFFLAAAEPVTYLLYCVRIPRQELCPANSLLVALPVNSSNVSVPCSFHIQLKLLNPLLLPILCAASSGPAQRSSRDVRVPMPSLVELHNSRISMLKATVMTAHPHLASVSLSSRSCKPFCPIYGSPTGRYY